MSFAVVSTLDKAEFSSLSRELSIYPALVRGMMEPSMSRCYDLHMNQTRIIQGYPVPGSWKKPIEKDEGGKPGK